MSDDAEEKKPGRSIVTPLFQQKDELQNQRRRTGKEQEANQPPPISHPVGSPAEEDATAHQDTHLLFFDRSADASWCCFVERLSTDFATDPHPCCRSYRPNSKWLAAWRLGRVCDHAYMLLCVVLSQVDCSRRIESLRCTTTTTRSRMREDLSGGWNLLLRCGHASW